MSYRFDALRILIVDDNAHMRALLRKMLYALGVKSVRDCADGGEAFTELRANAPDIVITDLAMRPIDGIAFTTMVRSSADSPSPYVPIILLTAHTEAARVTQARDAGVTEILAKPISVQGLLMRLVEIIERPRPFVKCPGYFGPDRRRRRTPDYAGPFRRAEDGVGANVVEM